MTVYVLVHGAWDGWVWQPLRRRLVAAGADVYAPSPIGSGERAHLGSPSVGLDTYVQDIVNLLVFEDLRDAVLVVYSFSGLAVTAAAAQVPAIAARVHVDEEVLPPRTYIRCISDEPGGAFDDAAARAQAEG